MQARERRRRAVFATNLCEVVQRLLAQKKEENELASLFFYSCRASHFMGSPVVCSPGISRAPVTENEKEGRKYRRGVTTTDIVSPEQADRKERSLRVPPLAYPGSKHRSGIPTSVSQHDGGKKFNLTVPLTTLIDFRDTREFPRLVSETFGVPLRA